MIFFKTKNKKCHLNGWTILMPMLLVCQSVCLCLCFQSDEKTQGRAAGGWWLATDGRSIGVGVNLGDWRRARRHGAARRTREDSRRSKSNHSLRRCLDPSTVHRLIWRSWPHGPCPRGPDGRLLALASRPACLPARASLIPWSRK
jgi:hypothetical protein